MYTIAVPEGRNFNEVCLDLQEAGIEILEVRRDQGVILVAGVYEAKAMILRSQGFTVQVYSQAK